MRLLNTFTTIILLLTAPGLAASNLVVFGKTIYTMEGDVLGDGAIVIRDGIIRQVGPRARVKVPKGYPTLEAEVVTPGLVDAHSTVGLSGIYGGRSGQVRDQDQLETSDPIQPELDPVDAYNASEPLIEFVRRYGVTTLHTGHGPGAVVSGRTMIVKTRGKTVEEALVLPDVAIAITLGPLNSGNFKTPGTRAKSVAMLRSAFIEAENYGRKRKGDTPPGRDIGKEILLRVLAGDIKAMITANTVTDIDAALRLRDEFGFDLLLDSVVDAPLLIDEISAARVPVLLHAPMLRASGDTKNAAFDTGRVLAEAAIPFAYQSGHEGYAPKVRVLLFETAVAVANGLDRLAALRAITASPAEILGIDDKVGSIEKGKHGDLVLFNGDPFEYTTQVCGVIIEGAVVSDSCH